MAQVKDEITYFLHLLARNSRQNIILLQHATKRQMAFLKHLAKQLLKGILQLPQKLFNKLKKSKLFIRSLAAGKTTVNILKKNYQTIRLIVQGFLSNGSHTKASSGPARGMGKDSTQNATREGDDSQTGSTSSRSGNSSNSSTGDDSSEYTDSGSSSESSESEDEDIADAFNPSENANIPTEDAEDGETSRIEG